MRFICDGREYETTEMHLVATGQPSMPILFIHKDYTRVVAIVRSREGVTARPATREELGQLQLQAPHPHLEKYLRGGREG
jgi:hypothetical protein